ncbi:MAG TPA: hypothetical protein EYN67_08935 [Flavobacteriales bacterium]|nr:hypothetical protein [Flavobacteriales bacterium]
MKHPKRISVIIMALALGIIGGASWCLLSGTKPLEQKVAGKVTEKVIDTVVDKVADKAKEELQEKVIDKIFK